VAFIALFSVARSSGRLRQKGTPPVDDAGPGRL